MNFTDDDCVLCLSSSCMTTGTATALYQKYSTTTNFYFTGLIDTIANEHHSALTVRFHESLFLADDYQYLKREYLAEQYSGKIGHLSDYYKFNRDLPRCHDKQLDSLLYRYHDRLRQYDFRRVKTALKREQGISITSQHNSSSEKDSQIQLKSNYSSVLHDLSQSKNQSKVLNSICDKINAAFGDAKMDGTFKGNFIEAGKRFEEFIQKEEQRGRQENAFKRRQHLQKQDIKNKENTFKNTLNFMKLKPTKFGKKSIEKTTANETISREQRSKKVDKLQKFQHIYRPLINGISSMKGSNCKKAIDQIYKSSFHHNDKYQSIKGKKYLESNKKVKKVKTIAKSIKNMSLGKEVREERYPIESERIHRQDGKKSVRKNSTLIKKSEGKTRQQTIQSFKILPKHKATESKEKNEKTLSKSKARLSKQNSRQSLHSRQPTTRSISNFNEANLHKTTVGRPQKQQCSQIDKLLSKKLALFIKC